MRVLVFALVFVPAQLVAAPAVLIVPQGRGDAALEDTARRIGVLLAGEHRITSRFSTPSEVGTVARDVAVLLGRAKQASRKFAEVEALSHLDEAERIIKRRCREMISVQPLLDLLLLRARLLTDLGRAREAKRALRKVAALAPSARLDPGRFPPVAQREHEALRRVLAKAAPATLNLTSVPEGAKVTVDSKPRGRTPIRIEVPPGVHLVAVGEVGASRASLVEVAEGTSHELTFVVPRLAQDDQALRAVGRVRGARWVLILRRGDSAQRLRARLLPVAHGLAAREVIVGVGDGAADPAAPMAARVAALTRGEETEPASRVSVALYRRWWFWTIVGVVAAGAGATAGIVLTREAPGVRLHFSP